MYDKWTVLSATRFALASIVALGHLGGLVSSPGLLFAGAPAFEAILGFLLISGYSIGSSYSRRPERFYARRVERVYPVYVIATLLTVAATGRPGLMVLAANMLFLNQIVTNHSFVGPAWTLALEVWLYALTPLLAKLDTRTLLRLGGASLLSYLIYTPLLSIAHATYFTALGGGINLLFLSFIWIFGFTLARLQNRRILFVSIGALAVHIAYAFLIQALYRFKHRDLHDLLITDVPLFVWRLAVLTIVALVFFGIVFGIFGSKRSYFINKLGDISYPIYLFHFAIYDFLISHGVVMPAMLIAMVVITASLSHFFVEIPLWKLMNYRHSIVQPRARSMSMTDNLN